MKLQPDIMKVSHPLLKTKAVFLFILSFYNSYQFKTQNATCFALVAQPSPIQ